MNGWEIVQNTVKNYTKEDTGLKIKVLREGEEKEFTITPVMTSTTSSQGLREDRFTIGIVPWLTPSIPEMTTVKYGCRFRWSRWLYEGFTARYRAHTHPRIKQLSLVFVFIAL